jgi:ribonucleotide reductase beta subunit family protein with ferritin-like domain
MHMHSVLSSQPSVLDPARDKRLINCSQVDVNQLMPLKYHWAWALHERLRESVDAD